MQIRITDVKTCEMCSMPRCSYMNIANVKEDFFRLPSETTVCPTGALTELGPREKDMDHGFISGDKSSPCVKCGLCVRTCPYGNLEIVGGMESVSEIKDDFSVLTERQVNAVTSQYLSLLFGFAANTNRNRALSFDGYAYDAGGEEAFVEIDYNNDSLECVRRVVGDIIEYSGMMKLTTGIIVLSDFPHKGSHDVYTFIERVSAFPTTRDIKVYITTFSVLRRLCLHTVGGAFARQCRMADVLFCPAKEELSAYMKRLDEVYPQTV